MKARSYRLDTGPLVAKLKEQFTGRVENALALEVLDLIAKDFLSLHRPGSFCILKAKSSFDTKVSAGKPANANVDRMRGPCQSNA